MRILLWLTLGFTGGSALWSVLGTSLTLGLGGLLLFSIFFLRFSKFRIPALVLLGLGLGLVYGSLYGAFRLGPVRNLPEGQKNLTVTVTDYSRPFEGGCSAEGTVTLEGQTYKVRLYLQEKEVQPGDILRGSFFLRSTLPEAGTPGTYHRGMGIYALAEQKGEVLRLSGEKTFKTFPVRLRRAILDRIDTLFPVDAAGFCKALLLGDSEALTDAQDWALTVSGIRHVAAVSGLHVSVLYVILSILTLRHYRLTCILGYPLLLLFCAVTGFTPSVVRASVMLGILMGGQLLRRDYDGLTALSGAVLLMELLNPLVVTSLSFQLSAASVAGILTLCTPFYGFFMGCLGEHRGWVRKVLSFLCASAAVSFSALVLVTPLAAWHFGAVSLISPLTNLLTVWAAVWCFWGVVIVLGASLLSMPLAGILAVPVSLLVRYILGTARLLTGFPLAAVYTKSVFISLWLVVTYVLGAVFLLGRRKRPGLFAGITAAGLLLAVTLSWTLPRLENCRVTVLSSGNCTIVSTSGQTYVVNCGGGNPRILSQEAAEHLLSRGIFHMDGLILTGGTREELSAARTLLTYVPADRIYVPEGLALPLNERIRVVESDRIFPLNPGNLRIIPEKTNLHVLFDTPKYDILCVGSEDPDRDPLPRAQGFFPHADCLIGRASRGKDILGTSLLEDVNPETVILSLSKFGPSPETLLRLREYPCTVLRTDRQGTITLRR